MSDPVAPAIPPKVTHDKDEVDDVCECDSCNGLQSPPPPPSSANPKKKTKRYVPPQPDVNTFPSQEAFLESLSPIAIEQVDANSLKCPLCWKLYGEAPDPGFDNTEAPVALRCHHVFGDKCLKNTFGTPENSRTSLRPLLVTDARGKALGERLHAFATSAHGEETENYTRVFSKMMEDSYAPRQGEELFGKYWWPIIRHLQQVGRNMYNVTFLNNAIIMDYPPMKLQKHTPVYNAIQAGSLTPTSTDMNQPLTQAIQSSGSAQASLSTPTPYYTVVTLDILPSMVAPAQAVPLPSFGQFVAAAGPSGTWEEALAEETNLDKLTALQKQAQTAYNGSSKAQKSQALPDQEALDAARMHQIQLKEIQDRKKRDMIGIISRTLVDLYTGYLAERISQQNYDKKLEAVCTQSRLVFASVNVHERDVTETSYEIVPPVAKANSFNGIVDDELDFDSERMTFMVTRMICTACCDIGVERIRSLPVPKALWWRNDAKIPDGCPICHKILYTKGKTRYPLHSSPLSDDAFDGSWEP